MDVVHSSKRRLIRVCSSLRGQGDRLVVAIRHCSREYSPPRRGGEAARSMRSREATLFRADGVVSSEPIREAQAR